MLSAKGILQHLCRLKIGWDVLIPQELAHEWPAWKTALKQLAKRARVAPLRPMTIPHMELKAANMTACMDVEYLNLQVSVFWTDSITVQKYIRNGTPFSSVGRTRVPCAEALQRTRVRLPAWVPLLRVTPPLSPCFLSYLQLYYQ